MAEGKRYYWLKLKEDFFSSKRVKKLRNMAGGDTYLIIYLKLQLKAMKNDGVITYDHLEDNIADELALDLDENPDDIRATLIYLTSCGLAETSDDMSLFFPYSVENVGSENSSAQRVREYRERQKALHCNAAVTEVKRIGNGEIEKDKEIEIEQDTEIDGENTSSTASRAVKSCPFSQIRDLYHSICVSFPTIKRIDGARKNAVAARWRTYHSIDTFRELFQIAEASPFLKGQNDRNWHADFDWMMKPTNFTKILEHKYDERTEKPSGVFGTLARMYEEAADDETGSN